MTTDAVADVLARVAGLVRDEAAEGDPEEFAAEVVIAYLLEAVLDVGDERGYARATAEWKPQVLKLRADLAKARAASSPAASQDSMDI